MATRVKQKQNVIYSSLAESMLDGEIKLDDNSWSLTNNIISIVAITTTIVNAILIFWLFDKFRILAAAIGCINQSKQLLQPQLYLNMFRQQFQFVYPVETCIQHYVYKYLTYFNVL